MSDSQMQENELLGLSALIEQANMQVAVFDMGRSVTPVNYDDWLAFELGQWVWPTPVQQHAHFALLGYDETKAQTIAWFFKLPLDEQGKLLLGARDQLVQVLLERAAENAKALSEENADDLKSVGAELAQSLNPTTEKQARFNALARLALELEPTEYFTQTIELIDSNAWDRWQEMPIQGLAELATRQHEPGNAKRLANAFEHLELQPAIHLAALLDGENIQPLLRKRIVARLDDALHRDGTGAEEVLLMQALSGCDLEYKVDICRKVLNSSRGISAEAISVISGRFWNTLMTPDITMQFLENLANLDNGASFRPVLTQLLYFSHIRPFLLAAMNDPKASDQLRSLIAQLLGR